MQHFGHTEECMLPPNGFQGDWISSNRGERGHWHVFHVTGRPGQNQNRQLEELTLGLIWEAGWFREEPLPVVCWTVTRLGVGDY